MHTVSSSHHCGNLLVSTIVPTVLLGLALAGPTQAATKTVETIDRAFSVEGIPELVVRNVDGRVRLNAHEGAEVHVRAVKEVSGARSDSQAKRAADEVKVRIEQVGNRIEVETQYPKHLFSFGGPRVLVHYEISIPGRANVDAKTVDGPLEAHGIEGNIHLATVDGDLRAGACSGQITARSVDGDMVLERIEGGLEGRTVDGNLEADGKFGVLRVKSTDGDVTIGVAAGSNMDGDWSIRTTDGSIRVTVPEGFAAELDMEASDGSVELEHAVTLEGELSRHRLHGKLYGGGYLLHIRSSDGSIRLLKP